MSTTTTPPVSAPSPEPDHDLVLRAIQAMARGHDDPRQVQRALLKAAEDLTLCSVAAWERQRGQGTTAETLYVELQHARLLLREALDRVEILTARIERTDPRRRRHYTPPLRFRVLEHMQTYLLSVQETARHFLVSPQTIYNWLAEMRRHPDTTTVGSTIVPQPPLRRFSHGVRRLVQQMDRAGFGGKKKIAETLLRNAWKISPPDSAHHGARRLAEPPALGPDRGRKTPIAPLQGWRILPPHAV